MRCKPGDLALIIIGPDTGKLVTCIRLVGESEKVDSSAGPIKVNMKYGPVWVIDRQINGHLDRTKVPVTCRVFYDCGLMPIRPPDEDTVARLTDAFRV